MYPRTVKALIVIGVLFLVIGIHLVYLFTPDSIEAHNKESLTEGEYVDTSASITERGIWVVIVAGMPGVLSVFTGRWVAKTAKKKLALAAITTVATIFLGGGAVLFAFSVLLRLSQHP